MQDKNTKYISIIWHELRTPLTSIRGYLSMILEWDMWEISYEARKALNHCYDSSLRLIKLTNDILMLSKIESWNMEYYPSKFKILDFIKSVQNDVFVEAEEQKVELEIEIEKSLKNKSIYYDKDRLKQVFINLISNAIKFTPENKKVIVKASQREKNILFEIIDNWIWIPEDQLQKVFEKFAQVSSDLQKSNKCWLWIWLTITKNILKDIWSEIKVTSQVWKWSNFFFELKLLD